MDGIPNDASPELIEVDGKPPAAPAPAKEEAAQRVLTLYKRSWSMNSDKDVEEEILKGLQCTICFEPWTLSGPHQTTVLKCGHLFGRSCLLQCLQARKLCPVCNAKATAHHMRPVFAQHVIALDAEVKDKYSQMCEEEKQRRLELESANRVLQMHLRRERERSESLFLANEELRRKIASPPRHGPSSELPMNPHRAPLPHIAPPPVVKQPAPLFPALNSNGKRAALPIDVGALKFKVAEQIKVAQGRVFAFAGDVLVCTSKGTSAATKWGFWKLSLDDLRQRKFIPTTHDQIIRDIRVSPQGIALTASMDKRLTLTSLESGAALHSFLLPVQVWSCEWSKEDKYGVFAFILILCNSNYFFCGLGNGSVLGFDVRQLNAPVNVLCSPGGPSVHSLFHHPSSSFLIAASAGDVRCIDKPMSEKTVSRLRFPAAQGFTCSFVSHDAVSDSYLASFRSPDASKHILFRLNQDKVAWNGHSAATTLSRTRVFSLPSSERRGSPHTVFAATGDEATQAVLLWNSAGAVQQQGLPAHPSPILDVQFAARNNSAVLGSLSEGLLQLYVPDV